MVDLSNQRHTQRVRVGSTVIVRTNPRGESDYEMVCRSLLRFLDEGQS